MTNQDSKNRGRASPVKPVFEGGCARRTSSAFGIERAYKVEARVFSVESSAKFCPLVEIHGGINTY